MPVDTKKCMNVSGGAVIGEFVGMFLFVLAGAGTAMSGAGNLQISLAFGLAITAMAYSFAHHSGAQFNCAVTWGLVIGGKLGAVQGVCNFFAQFVGATLAAFALKFIQFEHDATLGTKGPGVACNRLGADVLPSSAFVGEMVFTGLLVLVVLETSASKRTSAQRNMGALAIGLAVFLGHCVLIPVDGCSINPTRSLGTALAAAASEPTNSPWDHFWIFVFGPIIGSSFAVVIFHGLRKLGNPADSAWLVDNKKAIKQELSGTDSEDEEE